MKLKPIASNMTELHLNNGTIVLFSYETPVAFITPDDIIKKTSTYYSQTTARHISKWFLEHGHNCVKTLNNVDQEVLDNLVENHNKLELCNCGETDCDSTN